MDRYALDLFSSALQVFIWFDYDYSEASYWCIVQFERNLIQISTAIDTVVLKIGSLNWTAYAVD